MAHFAVQGGCGRKGGQGRMFPYLPTVISKSCDEGRACKGMEGEERRGEERRGGDRRRKRMYARSLLVHSNHRRREGRGKRREGGKREG